MDKFKLSAAFNYLNECLTLLCEEMDSVEILSCKYFELPTTEKGMEEELSERIDVSTYVGEQALTKCSSAFRDLFLKENQSGKVIKRHPGLICINDPEKIIENRLRQINQAKLDFKKFVLSINNNDARFELVHSAIPGLITLAAYRQIHFESDEPKSVRFTWMQKHATKTLTKEQALALLERSSNYSNPRMIDQASWQRLVESEKARVVSLKSTDKLRIRRPTRVTPEVNVRFTNTHRYHVSGALPFFVLNPSEEIKLGDLNDFVASKPNPRKKEYDFLVDRIYLEKTAD